MEINNREIAKLLRSVAAALTLKNTSFFQVRAYETAADAVEHSTSEIKDLWEEGRLGEVPGIGKSLKEHLNELFTKGKVSHFEKIMEEYPKVLFDLLDIPGVGPKTAEKIANTGIKDLSDLRTRLESGQLLNKGFSEVASAKILAGLLEVLNKPDQRMLLPFATEWAQKIMNYMRGCKDVLAIDSLGSLRRKVVTIGDLDFAVSTKNPKEVVSYFIKMPGVKRVIGQGENKAVVMLTSGIHVDLLVGEPHTYGALLHHFTGSKHHNIHLRTLAEDKGYSISEYGVKNVKTGKIIPIHKEHELYDLLDMDTPEPEIREDTGEISAAIKHTLPKLIEYGSLKGDLHLHSSYPIEPSHDFGANSYEEIIEKALELGHEYIGFSDHSPSTSNHTKEQIIKILEKRAEVINKLKQKYPKIGIFIGLEADILPDGSISVPDEGLSLLDYCIVGVHSAHRQDKEKMTTRILKALSNPFVTILAHPTGRLLNKRDSYDADWEQIFKFAAKNKKILEINSFPDRLDLRDDLVRLALSFGCKFLIDSDAHANNQMDNLAYGISVARRGWAKSSDVVNTMPRAEFENNLKKV